MMYNKKLPGKIVGNVLSKKKLKRKESNVYCLVEVHYQIKDNTLYGDVYYTRANFRTLTSRFRGANIIQTRKRRTSYYTLDYNVGYKNNKIIISGPQCPHEKTIEHYCLKVLETYVGWDYSNSVILTFRRGLKTKEWKKNPTYYYN